MVVFVMFVYYFDSYFKSNFPNFVCGDFIFLFTEIFIPGMKFA
jgi:hypothetical protein